MRGFKKSFKIGDKGNELEITLARPSYNQMREVSARLLPVLMIMSPDEAILSGVPYETMKFGCGEDKKQLEMLDTIFDSDYTYPLELWNQYIDFAEFDRFLVQPELKRQQREAERQMEEIALLADSGMGETIKEILNNNLSKRLSTSALQHDMDGLLSK